jgi:hypothetical protein
MNATEQIAAALAWLSVNPEIAEALASVRSANNSEETAAELRRLREPSNTSYVGISRARNELHILWSKPVPGDRSRKGPSRFLREMHKKLEAAEESGS